MSDNVKPPRAQCRGPPEQHPGQTESKEVYTLPEVKSLPVGWLYPHPDNPRKDLGDLTELADNIKANGIFQNLTVVPVAEVESVLMEHLAAINRAHRVEDIPNGKAYVVVIGHRRLAAAKLAGLTEVPCVVVSLSPTEQIATMLEENMHRADLTIYEKTHGFQMMLDLGETVESIVKKRGFKESTVRRHLKYSVFDDQTFREATAKQITMNTLSEVAKIENPKKRNEVLASYGSNNFNWNLTNAVTLQEAKKHRPAAKAEILAYATEVEHIDYARCEHVMTVQFADYTPGSATPKEGTKGEFVVNFNDKFAAIYRKKRKAPGKKKSEKERALEQEAKRREQELAELTEAAYNLRRDFIGNLTVPKAEYPKLMKHLMKALITSNITYWGSEYARTFAGLLGVEIPNGWMAVEIANRLLEETEKAVSPDKPIIAAIYAAYGDAKGHGYWRKRWNGLPEYNACHALDYLYDFLCDFGYELSDVEQSLKDGKHPLFATESGGTS